MSLFTDIASEMLYPIIPLFLTLVLGAPMALVGLIEGLAESSANILKVLSGWYSDKTKKRKPFVIAGYSISAISKPLMAMAYGWPLVLVARLMDRTGKGLRTSARDALIADSSDIEHMGRSFGLHRSMDTIGAVAGPLIALGILYLSGDNYRVVFLAAFIPGLLSILLVTFFVSERKRHVTERISFKLSHFSRDYKVFLLISAIFALGNSSNVFLILRAENLGFSVYMVILSYILFNIVSSLGSFPLGTLSDRWGRRNILSAGFIVFGFVYFGFAWVQQSIYIWPLFMIYGLYEALTEGSGKAYVVDLVSSDKRGTALGIYHATTGFMMLFASIIAGLVWDILGPSAPFIYGGGVAILSSLLIVLFMPHR
ncbi:MAG: MFS transporter [ANME-2 cluster archaeon]|nr:MFS transporter [ANME-2 cluster archaeon]